MLAVLRRHREVHPYGIADVVQLWDVSTWWRTGRAVVGVVAVPGSTLPVVYAVPDVDAEATLGLLRAVARSLPPRWVGHLPRGGAAALAGTDTAWCHEHVKMALTRSIPLPDDGPAVLRLDRDDLDDVEALFATDPLAGDFFHPGLLDTGFYIGVRERDLLVAVAGVHVVEPAEGVAAIGNVATHPAHRRRGLGRRVVAGLAHRLLATVDVVGLNVRVTNSAARGLYDRLGFVTVAAYEEVEVCRTDTG